MMGQNQSWASGRGSDNVVGPRWEFVRIFAEGIGKLAGNKARDRWKKAVRLVVRMPEAAGLVG
ncbi:hypothetical protein BHM03_00059142, partial [Ensete ventricosum]